MRIYFDYPLATKENIKAVQDAINEGKDTDELMRIFDEEMLWDCIVVLSGNEKTPWGLLEDMDDNAQITIEDWQYDFIGEYIIGQQKRRNDFHEAKL